MEPAEKLSDMAKLWLMHPEGEYFLSKGGDTTPPPLYCNLVLTSKCNLRCSICWSQNYMAKNKIPSRSMERETFHAVAQTLFPLLTEVELNSYGEPLLYPHIDEVLTTINGYGCKVKIQSNATLLTPRIVELLSYQCGTLSLSIDAVGELFNQVRIGAIWERVDRSIRHLMKQRQPEVMQVVLYPTVSRRTLPDMLNVLKWAADVGLEAVHFHRFNPNPFSIEERPTNEEITAQRDGLLNWQEKNSGGPYVSIDGIQIGVSEYPNSNCLVHRPQNPWPSYPIFPGQHNCHRDYLCTAPIQHIFVDFDGDIAACCHSHETKLGYATSVEEFAAAWLGYEYRAIRKSLMHGSRFPKTLNQCTPCIDNFWEMLVGSHQPSTPATLSKLPPLIRKCLEFLREDLSGDRRQKVITCLQEISAAGYEAGYVDALRARLEITGKDILEIGGSACWYAPLFLAKGASSYTGVDIEMPLETHRLVSRGKEKRKIDLPLSLIEFCNSFRGVNLVSADVREAVGLLGKFDAIFIISTTEHFDDPEACLQAVADLLRPEGSLYINHHNYYCWNGHHCGPWTVEEIDAGDPRQASIIDWGHVKNFISRPDMGNYVNFIRIHELIDLLGKSLEVEKVELQKMTSENGLERLTPEIIASLPRYYRAELETSSVLIWCRKTTEQFERTPTMEPERAFQHEIQIRLTWATPESRYCHVARVPALGKLSGLQLYENDTLLGPAVSSPYEIRRWGGGRYCFRGNYLYFSSSDNSVPISNGRIYTLKPAR
jgi:MoaA/NifB/PqqE/SkfB family radical SAM enzyme/SAM-dependent methyltransferase